VVAAAAATDPVDPLAAEAEAGALGGAGRDVDGRLAVRSTSDAENPLRAGATPILTLDVWEHAYYLDYQNERERYVEGFIEHLVNWRFVAENLAGSAPQQDRGA
jgi:superoxide dismutase